MGESDLLQWAQSPIGVGGVSGGDLTGHAQVPSEAPTFLTPQQRAAQKRERHRPNRGRKKRTNKCPLDEPPWDILRGLGIYIPPNLANLSYTPLNWRRGPQYVAWRKQMHAMWGYRCHLCGHANAHTADHLIPLSKWSNQPYDPHLARPAHGIEGCPDCGIKCNSSRGNRALALEVGNYKPPVEL